MKCSSMNIYMVCFNELSLLYNIILLGLFEHAKFSRCTVFLSNNIRVFSVCLLGFLLSVYMVSAYLIYLL